MNKFKIVVDSGCDIPYDIVQNEDITIVPLTIDVNNRTFVDNLELDTKELIKNIKSDENAGKSSCPSPQAYIDAFDNYDEIFIVTLSSTVSGSYQSANIAKEMYESENPNAKVFIIDSYSASAAECLLTHKLINYRQLNLSFDEIVEKISNDALNAKTYFVLDDMSTLIKNGRIKGIKAFLVNKLNIKAIMTQKDGTIVQAGTGHGISKAITNLANIVKNEIHINSSLFISHVNADDKVELFIQALKKINCYELFNKITIYKTRGLASFYANDGGIIIAFD